MILNVGTVIFVLGAIGASHSLKCATKDGNQECPSSVNSCVSVMGGDGRTAFKGCHAPEECWRINLIGKDLYNRVLNLDTNELKALSEKLLADPEKETFKTLGLSGDVIPLWKQEKYEGVSCYVCYADMCNVS